MPGCRTKLSLWLVVRWPNSFLLRPQSVEAQQCNLFVYFLMDGVCSNVKRLEVLSKFFYFYFPFFSLSLFASLSKEKLNQAENKTHSWWRKSPYVHDSFYVCNVNHLSSLTQRKDVLSEQMAGKGNIQTYRTDTAYLATRNPDRGIIPSGLNMAIVGCLTSKGFLDKVKLRSMDRVLVSELLYCLAYFTLFCVRMLHYIQVHTQKKASHAN